MGEEPVSLSSTVVAILCRQGLKRCGYRSGSLMVMGMIRSPQIMKVRWLCLIKWSQANPVTVMSRCKTGTYKVLTHREPWRYLIEHGVLTNKIDGQSKKILFYIKRKISPRWMIRRQQAALPLNWLNSSPCSQTWINSSPRNPLTERKPGFPWERMLGHCSKNVQ